jgi:hypothetical protein
MFTKLVHSGASAGAQNSELKLREDEEAGQLLESWASAWTSN